MSYTYRICNRHSRTDTVSSIFYESHIDTYLPSCTRELIVSLPFFFFFQAEDGIRDVAVTGVQTCALPISGASANDAKGVNMAFRTWVGPREDQPFVSYQNFVNLRTVVWGVGLISLLLNL